MLSNKSVLKVSRKEYLPKCSASLGSYKY